MDEKQCKKYKEKCGWVERDTRELKVDEKNRYIHSDIKTECNGVPTESWAVECSYRSMRRFFEMSLTILLKSTTVYKGFMGASVAFAAPLLHVHLHHTAPKTVDILK